LLFGLGVFVLICVGVRVVGFRGRVWFLARLVASFCAKVWVLSLCRHHQRLDRAKGRILGFKQCSLKVERVRL